jgi:DNA-binding PadR family transcriptional regulator
MVPRLTAHVLAVLAVFLEDAARPRYGLDIATILGFKSGTLYPILARLERAGWLVSEREAVDPRIAGRAPKRYYRLTGIGAELGRAAVEEQVAALRRAGDGRLRPGLATS